MLLTITAIHCCSQGRGTVECAGGHEPPQRRDKMVSEAKQSYPRTQRLCLVRRGFESQASEPELKIVSSRVLIKGVQ